MLQPTAFAPTVLTPSQLNAWAAGAKPGARACYHVGAAGDVARLKQHAPHSAPALVAAAVEQLVARKLVIAAQMRLPNSSRFAWLVIKRGQ